MDDDLTELHRYPYLKFREWLDKIIEEDIKQQLTDYYEDNNIIGDNHHGSRAGHGTETATAHIDQIIGQNYDSNTITTILQTDLSAVFDTVDADILIQKTRLLWTRQQLTDTATIFTDK